jgi:hypothetical protein
MKKGSAYKIVWEKGRKQRLMSEIAVFGTKKEANLFKKETFRINPSLKKKIRKMGLKLKIKKFQ